MVGRTVGKYRIIDRIGRGGMGIVYQAVDETLDRPVAIKVLNSEFGDAALLKRFRAEAVALARLNHPGIATIYEFTRQDDELMMVMEYVRGETLHQFADRVGPLEPPQVAHICMQVLEALGHAHRAGVIHRDLKPANLMLTETGAVKVMDFGIARVLGADTYTLGGLTMGTPAYMSPEQVTGQPIDARSDLYAIGVVFYRLLAGRLPFVADTAIAMAQKQLSEQPTPLSEIRPDLPAWCSAIVDRALAKDPDRRFQTSEEFRAALASAVVPQNIGELPTLATPSLGTMLSNTAMARTTHAAARADSTPTLAVDRGSTAERTNTTVVLGRTHLVAIAALVLVLVAAVVVLAVAAFRGRSIPAPVATGTPPAASTAALVETPPPTAEPLATTSEAGSSLETGSAVPPPVAASGSPSSERPRAAKPAAAAIPAPAPASPETETSAPAPAASEPAATADVPAADPSPGLPAVAFGNVRLLVMDGDRLRERRGVLRVAGGEVVLAGSTDSTLLAPLHAVTSLNYSRSKHPRWRDDSGREVAMRVDLGRFSFFRGDRNWLILATTGEPVIFSVEDAQLQLVIDALQARTGMTTRRFQ